MTDSTFLPELNINLLTDLVNWAVVDDAHINDPRFSNWGNWDQGYWGREDRNGVCNTAFCIAGQAVVQSGFQMNLHDDGEIPRTNGVRRWSAETCSPTYFAGLDDNGKAKYELVPNVPARSISTTARELIGLHYSESEALFSSSNGIDKVVYIATAIAASRGYDLVIDNADTIDYFDSMESILDHVYFNSEWNDETHEYIKSSEAKEYLALVLNKGKIPVPTCETCGQTLPEDAKVTE